MFQPMLIPALAFLSMTPFMGLAGSSLAVQACLLLLLQVSTPWLAMPVALPLALIHTVIEPGCLTSLVEPMALVAARICARPKLAMMVQQGLVRQKARVRSSMR